jgi:hypothetical protein
MSLRYAHTLVPTSSKFIPKADQVQAFLAAMIARGVIGGKPALVLRTPSERTREARNPFTGEIAICRPKDHKDLSTAGDVVGAIAKLQEYDVETSGIGRPSNPPLPLEFDDEYHVAVACRLSPRLCCTCDLHEESEGAERVPFFGQPSDRLIEIGLFRNPRTLDIIEVPGAGCAHFWIEFQLGNWLIPTMDHGNLELLDPFVVREAERLFQVRFAQGCCWG